MREDRNRTEQRARRGSAAERSHRPGRGCNADAGQYRPVVALSRCEGKGACVSVCPYNVFEVAPVPEDAFRALPITARFKLWVHGKKTALTPNADACRACGLCVAACPERAITLVMNDGAGSSSRQYTQLET